MRLEEFCGCVRNEWDGKHIFAWARYKRGDIPTQGEYDYINGRVLKKYPNAELISLSRRYVPTNGGKEPNEVRWEFCWFSENNVT